MTPWLSPDAVEQLTGRVRWSAQCRALAGMGIPFRPNADGRPLVEASQVLSSPPTKQTKRDPEPNWGVVTRG